MTTKAQLERENDELIAAVQEARAVLDRALGVDEIDDEEDEDAESDLGDE
jgi:hypothetical protein